MQQSIKTPRSRSDSTFFVYGPPGSGKTTLGRRLAESLALPFYDLDDLIVSQAGMSIPEIFAQNGEADFRLREKAALLNVLDDKPGVVALGGGALVDETNQEIISAHGQLLCLQADYETLLLRAQTTAGERPLIAGDLKQRLEDLMAKRAAHYASFPLQQRTDLFSLDETAFQAQTQLGAFHITGMGAGYDVRVVSDGLDAVGMSLKERKLKGPIAVVSDSNVAPLYTERILNSLHAVGYTARSIVIRAGEANKTIDTVMGLWAGFLNSGLERGSTVLALGGGVVGDLAGFAAATYLRGVRWVAVPTTLLAMVDASLGGKTGADLQQGKNLIGAFHSPSLVYVDPQVLATLPPEELRNGMAEVVKHAILADPDLFELCRKGWDALSDDWAQVVSRAMAVKVRVILEDPYEKGRRASLNLGHTLGHAIELVSGFGLKHGEAVAVGTLAAARLSERMDLAQPGLAAEINAVLSGLELPTEIPTVLDLEEVLSVMQRDKKKAAGKVRFVLPVDIGDVRWGIEVEDPRNIFG